ncbi:protein of unknown function [Amycolatopsis xylanica]|uniref:DUF4034 domain-containing protein n=1 Tax=Amycolatopsis xylanica TaxID=589385 RepID=A0A1H2ZD19_9PSEU|nr:DUF4034 domain-containing protein [Amycolatopsis xylanica]SDX15281.1 protein of unknown function [Amycolatopsis xylanica]
MVFSMIFKPKERRAILAMMREAKKRGVEIDELADLVGPFELMRLTGQYPDADVTKYGLVPDDQVVKEIHTDPALKNAADAAKRGEWQQAAMLVNATWGDWETRGKVVSRLAAIAADDDTWLKSWQRAEPGNPHAAVVDAEALVYLAWQIRGGKWASETSAAQFAGFERTLNKAEAAAWQATELVPADPTPWSTLITLGRGLSVDHEDFDRRWQGLMERAPLHRRGHDSALQYWCAKWQGSHEEMVAFARSGAAKSPTLSGLIIRAAYEWEDANQRVWQEPWARQGLETHLAWLSADGADNHYVHDDLGWAITGLMRTKRDAEAIPLFQRLGAYAGGEPWNYHSDPVGYFCYQRATVCLAAKKR